MQTKTENGRTSRLIHMRIVMHLHTFTLKKTIRPIDSLNAVITKIIVKKFNYAITFPHCSECGLQNVGLK